jgi:hypothetical protein
VLVPTTSPVQIAKGCAARTHYLHLPPPPTTTS